MLWQLLLEIGYATVAAGFVSLSVVEMMQLVDDVMKQIETGAAVNFNEWSRQSTHSEHPESLDGRMSGQGTCDHFRRAWVKRVISPGIV